eukprot:TRINITY_DN2876_c0_g1_i1.p1 TRINITY_DN2876_c0_g1~~TRINITY_DN2876_c0_g1_i1.p1  ORF type:complete len:114 (-),score=11.53 TRINITY_DN2876_c0_g1_i1:178-519(-)
MINEFIIEEIPNTFNTRNPFSTHPDIIDLIPKMRRNEIMDKLKRLDKLFMHQIETMNSKHTFGSMKKISNYLNDITREIHHIISSLGEDCHQLEYITEIIYMSFQSQFSLTNH